MFDDDNAARHAFRTLADEPAPPVETTFDEVLRRGRRRVLAQRASAVAGVVAVVGAIGVGAILLRPDDQAGGVRVGGTDTTVVSSTRDTPKTPQSQETPSAPTSTPPTPQSTSALPGWNPVNIPPSVSRESEASCDAHIVEQPPPLSDQPVDPQAKLMWAFSTSVGAVLPIVREDKELVQGSVDGSPRLYYSVDVAMDNGNGQLQLEAGTYGGAAEKAANTEVAIRGACNTPYRRIMADGTVLQLYPAEDTNGDRPIQSLRIYRPDQRIYIITSAGYSAADIVRGRDSTSETISGGRGKLPTTDAQFAEIAERLVNTLG